MNEQAVAIKRALISVSDKTGLAEFARGLHGLNIEIISTGGTAKFLRDAGLPVTDVSSLTQFPEIMDGRVKTLHPKIHGGILGLRDVHAGVAIAQEIPWIDLVVVNLYPFAATIAKPAVCFDEAIENIDIGGPTMIRSAAKNMGWVGVIVDPAEYAGVLSELQQRHSLSYATRRRLAGAAFTHTAGYDAHISAYLTEASETTIAMQKSMDLRYGENPHQAASAWQFPGQSSILTAQQLQGKPLSYNNIADSDAAFQCVREFAQPACVIVKHATPCGVAIGDDIATAFQRALAADKLSAFGGIVALNRTCTAEVAAALSDIFMEVLLAPDFSPDALTLLARKTNLRVLVVDFSGARAPLEMKFISGGVLQQMVDTRVPSADQLSVVTQVLPDAAMLTSLQFAWQVVKHVKSNAIVLAKDFMTVGIGGGQVSRVDAVDLAMRKAGKSLQNCVLASDAFFPFRDSIDHLQGTGVRAIIQPGGSVRDNEVIDACNALGIAMVFTGVRCFKH